MSVSYNPVTGEVNIFTGSSGGGGGGPGGLTPTAIKTSNYTCTSNELVRCDSTGGAFNVTLPVLPVDGARVGIIDVASSFLINPVTLVPGNVAHNIQGGLDNVVLNVVDAFVELIFNSVTSDWRILETPNVIPVASVHGRTGTVAAANGDYTASQVTVVPAGSITSTTVQAALEELSGAGGGATWASVTSKPNFLDWTPISSTQGSDPLASVEVALPMASWDEIYAEIMLGGSTAGGQQYYIQMGNGSIDTGGNYSSSIHNTFGEGLAITGAGSTTAGSIPLSGTATMSGVGNDDALVVFTHATFRKQTIPSSSLAMTLFVGQGSYISNSVALPVGYYFIGGAWKHATLYADRIKVSGAGNMQRHIIKLWGRNYA